MAFDYNLAAAYHSDIVVGGIVCRIEDAKKEEKKDDAKNAIVEAKEDKDKGDAEKENVNKAQPSAGEAKSKAAKKKEKAAKKEVGVVCVVCS